MIRINLLPFRAARKKENIRRQVSIFVLSLIFVLTLMAYFWLNFNNTIAALKTERDQKQAKLDSFADVLEQIKEIEKKIAQLQRKLDAIRGLEESKTGPVKLLDEISMAVPRGRLWLNSLSEKQGVLKLNGTAKDNDTVALFMTNLEKGKQIKSVDLDSVKSTTMKEYEKDLVDFSLTCRTASHKEEPAGRGRRRR